MSQPASPAPTRPTGAWTGFLVAAFAVVGLIGAYGVTAAQLPYERAMSRNAALDAVLQAAANPDAAARLAALRPRLGDSAPRVLDGPADPAALATRVAAERPRMMADFVAEARALSLRLRIVIGVFAAAGALFGAAVLSVVARAR